MRLSPDHLSTLLGPLAPRGPEEYRNMFRYLAPLLDSRLFQRRIFDYEAAHRVEARGIETALAIAAQAAAQDHPDRRAMYLAAQAAVELHLAGIQRRRRGEWTAENSFMYRDGVRRVINALAARAKALEPERSVSAPRPLRLSSPLAAPFPAPRPGLAGPERARPARPWAKWGWSLLGILVTLGLASAASRWLTP